MASVLVVDDETHVRQVLGWIIGQAGHEVIEAESSDAALKVMAQGAADVVFTDIQMPGKDGRWLTLEVRRLYPATPVVLATSVSDLEPHITLKFGVLSYLVKPFSKGAVLDALSMAVGWHEDAVRRPQPSEGADV